MEQDPSFQSEPGRAAEGRVARSTKVAPSAPRETTATVGDGLGCDRPRAPLANALSASMHIGLPPPTTAAAKARSRAVTGHWRCHVDRGGRAACNAAQVAQQDEPDSRPQRVLLLPLLMSPTLWSGNGCSTTPAAWPCGARTARMHSPTCPITAHWQLQTRKRMNNQTHGGFCQVGTPHPFPQGLPRWLAFALLNNAEATWPLAHR